MHAHTHSRTLKFLFFSSCIIFFLSCIIISFCVSVLSNVQQQNKDILLFRVSHDTLVHRDTTSIVRRVSEAKTDCERSVPSVPTLASPRGNHHLEKPATLRVSRPRRRKTYFTSLHRAQLTAL